MKNKGTVDKILHFLVHNSFLFTVEIMCIVHASLLVVMLFAHVIPLVFFNVLSVIVYLFCIMLCKVGHIMPVYISILLEVIAYAITAVYFIGWSSGSYDFLFSIVPIIIYFGSFLFKGKMRWIIILSLGLILALFMILYFCFSGRQPVYELSYTVRTVIVIFSAFVMFFAMVFYSAVYIYSSQSEMTSLEQKNEQLTVDAKEDALTSLLNRRGFIPLVEALMNDPMRHFCIAFCDIDNFKRINDSYGHDCGDEVLGHISTIIKKEMHGCAICRWGGEEFVILMEDYDFAVAIKKMEYIRKLIETTPTVFYNKRIAATITIGLEEYKETYKEPERIIKVADERMYYGKQHGKNILIYEDHDEPAQEENPAPGSE